MAVAAPIVAVGLGLRRGPGVDEPVPEPDLARIRRRLWAHALAVGSGRNALLETQLGIEMYCGRSRSRKGSPTSARPSRSIRPRRMPG